MDWIKFKTGMSERRKAHVKHEGRVREGRGRRRRGDASLAECMHVTCKRREETDEHMTDGNDDYSDEEAGMEEEGEWGK